MKKQFLTYWLCISVFITGLLFIYPIEKCRDSEYLDMYGEFLQDCESYKIEYVALLVTIVGAIFIYGKTKNP